MRVPAGTLTFVGAGGIGVAADAMIVVNVAAVINPANKTAARTIACLIILLSFLEFTNPARQPAKPT